MNPESIVDVHIHSPPRPQNLICDNQISSRPTTITLDAVGRRVVSLALVVAGPLVCPRGPLMRFVVWTGKLARTGMAVFIYGNTDFLGYSDDDCNIPDPDPTPDSKGK